MPFHSKLSLEFVDGDDWIVTAPLIYGDEKLKRVIEVPAGFVTDFASVPRGLWNLFPPTGEWGPAAVVHDFLYRFAPLPRAEADLVFLHAMEDLKVGWFYRRIIYRGVRLFGFSAYKG